ncbi:MAG: sigma-54-dependent Fis family transcriptional regulator [Candidatus Binatia bacterium]
MTSTRNVQRSSEESRRIRRIRERFLAGNDAELGALRPIVRGSWLRSRAHAVDPRIRAAPIVLGQTAARTLRENDVLKAAATPVMHFLVEALDRALVLLSDAQCRPIDIRGGARTLDEAAQINVVIGSQWSEDQVGTDAVAVSTLLDRPVQIHWSEHYSDLGERWSGNAAPIHHLGEKLGSLSVYGYDEVAHPRALELVSGCATMIEHRLAEDEHGRRLVLFDRYEAHHARFPQDALLCVSSMGAVVAVSSGALDLLGLAHEQAVGRALTRLPGLRVQEPFVRLEGVQRPCDLRLETQRGAVRANLEPVARDGTVIGFIATLAAPLRAVRRRGGAPGWETSYRFGDIVGESAAIRRAVADAQQVAERDLPLLIQGESGTGKELFAHAIHYASRRRAGAFVPLNCGGMNDELLGAELFGYADGAFTGAARGGRPGKIELADGGTLFLDEVESMPARMQSHLLRVLEEGRVVRMGAERPRRIDVRVIAATKVELGTWVTEGRFRADLYHRLNVLALTLPPLRERAGDAPILARHLLAQHGIAKALDVPAVQWLNAAPWPGNVRELRNALLKAVQGAGAVITVADFAGAAPAEAQRTPPATDLRNVERQAILDVLRACRGNVSLAAARLGVHRITLHRKMRRHGITLPRRPE